MASLVEAGKTSVSDKYALGRLLHQSFGERRYMLRFKLARKLDTRVRPKRYLESWNAYALPPRESDGEPRHVGRSVVAERGRPEAARPGGWIADSTRQH